MIVHGSKLSFPFRADEQRGTLVTTADRSSIIEQSIADIIETRQGQRVMLPDYGLPDYVFAVMDAGFVARLAYHVEEQLKRYEPLIDKVNVKVGVFENDRFVSSLTPDQHRAILFVEYSERGTITAPRNLVFPVWKFVGANL